MSKDSVAGIIGSEDDVTMLSTQVVVVVEDESEKPTVLSIGHFECNGIVNGVLHCLVELPDYCGFLANVALGPIERCNRGNHVLC